MKIEVYENNRQIFTANTGNKCSHFYIGLSKELMNHYQDKMSNKEEKEITVKTSKGNANFMLKKSSYSLRIFETENSIKFSDVLDFDKDYHLEMIGAEHNNYKYYELKKIGENEVTATWGRIAPRSESHLRVPYTYEQAYMKLGEKLAKGYVDMSFKINENEVSHKSSTSKKLNQEMRKDCTLSSVSSELYQKLLAFAKNLVKRTFRSEVRVTPTMVKKATALYKKLVVQNNLEEFNEILMQIMLLAPRNINFISGESVKDYLAKSTEDFREIIDREETILNSLQVIDLNDRKKSSDLNGQFSSDFEITKATEKEVKEVKANLNDTRLESKIKNIYKIKCKKQEKAFDRYVAEKGITNIKRLWHGSRNENWLSIIINSLSLNPNAVITGKAFGNGIYFALESDKSYGYTSGGRWNGEYSNTRFMGLYKCAYGNPLLHNGRGYPFTKKHLEDRNCNCVHALGTARGGSLYRDEIIFFDENAMCLEYLVEFKD